MWNEWLAGVQIASIVTFVGATFVLYRLLVQQKQAQIDFLKDQLDEAQSKTADELTKALEARVTVLLAELPRMNEDEAQTEAELDKLVQTLKDARHAREAELAKRHEVQLAKPREADGSSATG